MTVSVADASFGDGQFGVIAGAPSTAPFEEALASARTFAAAGAVMLHDGSTSQASPEPRSLRHRVELGKAMRAETGLPVALALTNQADFDAIADIADVIHVAGYHMQDYTLLSELGQIDKPVLLRRGSASLLDELLMAAEYILQGGNRRVLLCERGIRTFECSYKVTVDFAAIPVLHERSPFPVLVDPSEQSPTIAGTMAVAAAAARADGIVLEASGNAEIVARILRAAAVVGAAAAEAR